MLWSVRSLIDFTYIPCLNEAFEGMWGRQDPADFDILDYDSDNSTELTRSESEGKDPLHH